MAKQTIDLGTLGGADGTGDSIRTAGAKINSNFDEIYANSAMSSQITITGNNIKTTLTNSDLYLEGSGSGVVAIPNITIDSNITIDDNRIATTVTNSDMDLAPAGTGSVVITKGDINDGSVDNTIIGGTTPAAATFTTVTATTSAVLDGVTVTDNKISSNASNSNLELTPAGTGKVSFAGINFPENDGLVGQILKTNGSGLLVFQGHSSLYDNSFIEDATATVLGNTSSAQVIDTWSLSTHRSVKYHIQISDATANRFSLIEANVTHNGSSAFISVFGGVDNGTGDGSTAYDSLDLSADVSSGNVRLLGTVNNTNNQVIKLVRRTIKV